MKSSTAKGKGAKSLLNKLADDDKAYMATKKVADKAAAAKAETQWKEKAEQTKKDEAAFKKKMQDTIKRLGDLKTKIASGSTSAQDKAAAVLEQKLKQKEANAFKVKYNTFKVQALANQKAEQAKVAAGVKAVADAKLAMVTDLAESKKNYLATQKSYNVEFGKLQMAIRK